MAPTVTTHSDDRPAVTDGDPAAHSAMTAAGRAMLAADTTEQAPTPNAPAPTEDAPPRRDSDDDLVQVHGARPCEPLLVRRGWLRDHLTRQPPSPRPGRAKTRAVFVPCDPLTGARLDPTQDLTTTAYRPTAELTALVKARDGHCRFPGCAVAARFCDLDHVRPWPTGPTAAHNLLTLCRRHHRIKQRPGWRLRLAPDGTTTWTDPTGRTRTTTPLDALHALVLTPDPTQHHADRPSTAPDPTAHAGALVDGPDTAPGEDAADDAATSTWSVLETILEFRLDHARAAAAGDQQYRHHPAHRRHVTATDVRAGFARLRAHRTLSDIPPF